MLNHQFAAAAGSAQGDSLPLTAANLCNRAKNVVAHVGLSYCPARVIGVAASVVCSDLRKCAGSGLCWAQSPDKRRNRRANLVRTVLLDELGACDRDFGLVWPCAAAVACSARGLVSRLGVDAEFRKRAFAEPAGIVPCERAHGRASGGGSSCQYGYDSGGDVP